MARAKYYIKEQTTWRDTEKEEIREVFNSTRKADTERFLNGLFKEYKKAYNFYPHWVRQGYFKSEFACLGVNSTTEYWIEKY